MTAEAAPARGRHFLLTGPGWPGESTWFEGLQLLGVYVVLAIVFFAV